MRLFWGLWWGVMGGWCARAAAQDSPSAAIRVLVRSFGDSVVVRWAPTTPGAWAAARAGGYVIHRQKLGTSEPPRRLTPDPVRPWDSTQWVQRLDTTNPYLLIALQATYGGFQSRAAGLKGLQQRAQDLANRHAFALYAADMDPIAAEALGLRWVDRSVEPGATYLYTVAAAVPDSVYPMAAGDAAVTVGPPEPLPAPPGLTAQPGDRRITLQWMHSPTFTAYWIERSDDRGRTYRRLTSRPYARLGTDSVAAGFVTFIDTAVRNYFRYHYRVRGISPFAEVSAAAEAFAMPQDFTPPPPPRITTGTMTGPRQVRLEWTIDPTPDLSGFLILRSSHAAEGYQPIQFPPLSAAQRRYTDTAALFDAPYYIVAAIDTNGNVSRSMPFRVPMVDTIPPLPPTGLRGTIDTAGVVRLWWQANREPDLLEYRVLRANDSSHAFIQRTNRPIADTFFIDTVTIHTLTPFVYYRVSAVDVRFNHSPMSAVLALRRPDLLPPAPPVWKKVRATDSAVWLEWVPSPSEDVVWQIVERRRSDTGTWQRLVLLPPDHSSYADHSAEPNLLYYYRVVAEDSAGHQTPTLRPAKGRRYAPYGLPSPAFVEAQYEPDFQVVRIRWTYPYPIRPGDEFVIYRSIHDGPLMPYKAVPATTFSFEDAAVVQRGLYRYAVALRRGTTHFSPHSRVVVVEVR